MKNNAYNHIIAAILFICFGVLNSIFLYEEYIRRILLVEIICTLAIVIGLFSQKYVVSACGSLLDSLLYLYECIHYCIVCHDQYTLHHYAATPYYIRYIISMFLSASLFLCFFLIFLTPNHRKMITKLGLLFCSVAAVSIIINLCVWHHYPHPSNSYFTSYGFINILAYILVGVAYLFCRNLPEQTKTETKKTKDTAATIESLGRLKELLDKGIITKEEFEEKKANLMS